MSQKVEKKLMVDSEVAAVCDVIVAVAQDIQAKADASKYISDVSSKLLPAIGDIANLAADLKANPDNRKYIAMALEAAADVFLFPPAAPVAHA
jgi:hypothetical protein